MSFGLKNFLLVASLILAAGTLSRAAEKPLLDVNFGSQSWQELMPARQGDIAVSGNVANFAPKSSASTALLPVRKGDSVTVTLDVSGKGLMPIDSEATSSCGVICFYNKAKSVYAHQDIGKIKGDSDWKTHTLKFVVDERCAFIGIEISNTGKAGQAFFRGLKISTREDSAELIGDSGFEDVLGVNYWFFKRSGTDWDGFKFLNDPGRADLDTKIFATGTKSLRLTGGAVTLVSKTFAYNGETLIISGWFRGDGIKPGKDKPGWAGAGIQVIGLNEKGVEFCHKDLEILTESTPWRFRQSEFSFVGSVKKFQVCLRMFEGAQGTLWLDEVRLRSLPKDIRPFDKDKAAVAVDLSSPEPTPINYKDWAGVDVCGSGWITHPEVQQCFPYLKAAGFEYLRLRDMSNMLGLYPRDGKDGKPEYHWEKFDQLFDVLVKDYHFVPVITLGTTPPALDRPGSRQNNWCNDRVPADLKKWRAYMEATFEHAIQRYGKEEVGKWLWEIWNEPNLPSQSVGTLDEFADLVVSTYQAKERIDAKYGIRIMLGLTSGGNCDEYLVQRLKAAGKQQLIEHRSCHYYGGADNSITAIIAEIADAKAFKKGVPGLKDYPIGCTEWNSTAMVDDRPNTAWNAAMAVKMVKIFLDEKLDYATYFDLVDHPECPVTQQILFPKEFGLFTRPNDGKGKCYKPIPKPTYNAFVFLNELKGGKRLPFKSSNDPVDGIAVVMPDGSLRLVLTSYDDDTTRQPYTTKVALEIKGLPQHTKYRCTRLWAADEQYGNSYGEWLKLGSPDISDVKATDKVLEASKYGVLTPPALTVTDGTARLSVPLPSPGIRLVELKPE